MEYINTLAGVPKQRSNGKYFKTFNGNPVAHEGEEWLPVVQDPQPTFDPITEQLVRVTSLSVEGTTVDGHLVGNEWHRSFEVLPQENLEAAKANQQAILEDEFEAKKAEGFGIDGIQFNISEEEIMLQGSIVSALQLSNINVNQFDVELLDENGVLVTRSASDYYDMVGEFGEHYVTIQNIYRVASSEITAAQTVQEVNDVTWAF